MTFTHIHSSSRYDRPPASLEGAVAGYVHQGADLITFTEVEAEQREDALMRFGWEVATGDIGNRNDCAVMWDKQVWKLVAKDNAKVTGKTFFSGSGHEADVVSATTVVLWHRKTKKVLVISVIHLPSSVQGKGGLNDSQRAQVWMSAARGWRRHYNKLARRYKADGVLAVSDFNIDTKQAWARALIKAMFPSMKLTWMKPYPKGTHGNRLIDGTLMRGKLVLVRRPRLLPKNSSSDHTPYMESFGWRK